MLDFDKLFLDSIKNNIILDELLSFVKRNSKGNIWVIGGFVYRNIIEELYGENGKKIDYDLDVIIEKPLGINLPEKWTKKINSYGNPKFIKGKIEMDFIPLDNIHSINRLGLKPNIENFLKYTPLNIQSIAFDLRKKTILGEMGKDSIINRIVSVNNLEQAMYYSSKKKKKINDLILEKTEEISFKPIIL